MNAANIGYLVQFAFIVGAALFVVGLHLMNSPATARTGNHLSAAGMITATVAELVFVATGHAGIGNWAIIIAGLAIGCYAGLRLARTVAMTAMPQLVSLFNALGGGAAALLAINDFIASSPAARPASTAGERCSSWPTFSSAR
jgi:NAD(P) transhydrogenase subunit beta